MQVFRLQTPDGTRMRCQEGAGGPNTRREALEDLSEPAEGGGVRQGKTADIDTQNGAVKKKEINVRQGRALILTRKMERTRKRR